MSLVDDIVNDILVGDAPASLNANDFAKTASSNDVQGNIDSDPQKLADELEKVAFRGLSPEETNVHEEVLRAAVLTEALTGHNILERYIA